MTITDPEITNRKTVRVRRANVETDVKITAFDDGTHIVSLETYPVGLTASIHLSREEFEKVRAMFNEIDREKEAAR